MFQDGLLAFTTKEAFSMSNDKRMQIILVAGSRAEAKAWKTQVAAIQAMPEMQARSAEIYLFDSSEAVRRRGSASWYMKFWPTLTARTSELEACLEQIGGQGLNELPTTVLVGCRVGCSIIKSMLLNQLESGKLALLVKIRSVLFVHPKSGSRIRASFFAAVLLSVLGFLLPIFVGDVGFVKQHLTEQEIKLISDFSLALASVCGIGVTAVALLFSRETAANLGLNFNALDHSILEERFKEKISEGGSKKRTGTWPIPTAKLPGLNVARADTQDLKKIVSNIFEPPGHPNIHEVNLLEITYTLEPTPGQPAGIRDWGVMKMKKAAQFASRTAVEVHAEVGPFELAQGTSGRLKLLSAPENNLWDESEKGAFNVKGTPYIYRFWPQEGRRYEIVVAIEGGYTPGNMDSHQHPRVGVNYGRIREVLDLRPMLRAGYSLKGPEPSAYFLPASTPVIDGEGRVFALEGCDGWKSDLTRSEKKVRRLENLSKEEGYFLWEAEDVRNGGLFGWQYDLEAPASVEGVITGDYDDD